MSSKSWGIVVTGIASVVVWVSFAVFVAQNGPGPDDPTQLRWWATAMLAGIGILAVVSVAAEVLFRVAFSVALAARRGDDAKEVASTMDVSLAEDEMDRLIALRSARVGYIVLGIGVVGMMATLALGGAPVLGLNVVFWSFAVGSLASATTRIVGLERGVRG